MIVCCGIDVSKATLDAVALTASGERRRSFANDAGGFASLLGWCEPMGSVRFAMEATGPYHKALLRALLSEGQSAVCLNPYRARQLAIGLGILDKDDRVDALVLARGAQLAGPQGAPLASPAAERALEVCRRIQQLTRQLGKERARLKEPRTSEEVAASLLESVGWLKAQVRDLEARWLGLVLADPELARAYALLRSVPHIGPKTARVLLSELPPGEQILDRRKAVGLSGTCPRRRRSGTSLNLPDRTSRACNQHIKGALYMAAVQALRWPGELKEAYERLVGRGKHPKQAIVALMRKIFSRALAVLARGTPWAKSP